MIPKNSKKTVLRYYRTFTRAGPPVADYREHTAHASALPDSDSVYSHQKLMVLLEEADKTILR